MSKLSNKQNKKAFTIIEVVLVLAVAGLIFLVVFQAIPRLQRSRRDNERKRHAEAILSLMIEYQSNTGSYPTEPDIYRAFGLSGGAPTTSPFTSYIADEDLIDPTTNVRYTRITVSAGTPSEGEFLHKLGQCDSTGSAIDYTPPDGTAILMGLERGAYCLDSL